ncbi:MAG: DUF2815 family protein [Oscillospiraceae bacterium]|nr:DUF2815 family protein [Oscillospiraceae bacterium]
MNSSTITIGEVRFSYCNLFQPHAQQANAEPKYGTTVLVPKSNTKAKAAIDAAISAAIEAGVSKCWSGVRPPQPAICVHDGDGPRPSDGQPFSEECKGMWVFTASSKNAPFVVDANVQPVLQQSEIYSGMYGRVSVNFFAYFNSGKKGIGCGLNGVQKLRDGEPLSARVTAEEAFAADPAAYTPPQQQYAAPAPAYYPPQQQYAAQPAYPQYQAPAPGYPQQAMPGGYQVDPLTGQPIPSGMPIMGM